MSDFVTPEENGLKVFKPDGKVLKDFIRCNSHVQLIMGPWGSGKTAGCCVGKIWKYACEQAPDVNGLRRTRWFIVRNTYTDLKNTTLKTWKEWFPERWPEGHPAAGELAFGEITMSRPFRQMIKVGDVECEVLFLALDDEEDRKKLLSLEATGIYFNEFREIHKGIFDDATGRTGRFPSQKDRPAGLTNAEWPTWHGVIGDTNAPSEDHWFPIMAGHVPMPDNFTEEDIEAHKKPDTWSFFFQPPGMLRVYDDEGKLSGYKPNPAAENIKYHTAGYYDNMIKGKKPSWISVNVLNEYGRIVDGKPVFETFREDYHVAKAALEVTPGAVVYVGIDFGRTPAAVFAQNVGGQFRVLHELQAYNMGADRFAPILKRELATKFPGCQFALFGDPAGDDEGQASDDTPYTVFRANGLRVLKAYHNNKLNIRLEAVEHALGRLNDYSTGPRLLIDPCCKTLIAALNGGYQYKRIAMAGTARYSEMPFKNQYSHLADAFQYMLLGAGEGRALLNKEMGAKPVYKPRSGNVNTRRRARRRA